MARGPGLRKRSRRSLLLILLLLLLLLAHVSNTATTTSIDRRRSTLIHHRTTELCSLAVFTLAVLAAAARRRALPTTDLMLGATTGTIRARASAHRGNWGQLTPPGKMDEKLDSENMQKNTKMQILTKTVVCTRYCLCVCALRYL